MHNAKLHHKTVDQLLNVILMILCTDPILKERLKNQQIDATVFDSVLTESEKQEMLESLYRFASGWFIDKDGRDYTEYREVSLGGVLSDEVLSLFQMLYHFVWIIGKDENTTPIQFYDSKSCKIPEAVQELIAFVGGETKTTSDSYPYLCFRELYSMVCSTKTTYSLVDLSLNTKEKTSKDLISRSKIWIRILVSKFFHCFSIKKQFVYVQVLRSLVPFYRSYLLNGKSEFGFILAHNSKKTPYLDSPNQSRIENITNLVVCNLKGVRTDNMEYPKCWTKLPGSFNVGLHEQLVGHFKRNFHQTAASLLKDSDSKAAQFVMEYFERFFLTVLPRFIQAADYYYKRYNDRRIAGCLVEMIHPLKINVFSNLKKTSVLVPPNFFLHNQYFSPYLIRRLGRCFRPVAISEYDRSRYTRLGYKEEQVAVLDPGYFNELRDKLKPFKTIKTLIGAKVLIIPPWIGLLHTFRHLISGEDLIHYCCDILEILDSLKVSSVNIRIVPGTDLLEMNATHHTAIDCYRSFVDMDVQRRQKPYSFDISFSKSKYSNLAADVQSSDLVIGPVSGSCFDALLYGRDYVVYDRSVSPFPGIVESNLIDDGIIKANKCAEELRDHLENYQPINRDHVFRTYYPEIFLTDGKGKRGANNLIELLQLLEKGTRE
ncbi:hypothetical protein MYX82_01390 [Acidobacteria bacterium AH-259-D05]|nr:hypothetical protein [Acidobacteria bacterium AH-259-D05]